MTLRFLSTMSFAFPVLFLCSGRIAVGAFAEFSQLPNQATLPDTLVMSDGRPVTTKEQWITERRPELKALFEHYMYGHMPPAPKSLKAVVKPLGDLFAGKAKGRDVSIWLGPGGKGPVMHLLVVVPASGRGPAPVFVGPNFCGNHTVVNSPDVPLPMSWMPNSCPGCTANHATDAGRGAQLDTWAIEQSIDRGYAVATFYYGDVEGDRPDAPDGVRAAYPGYDWGAVAAWAWGASRAVDYLVTDKDIDPKRIAVVGHSRNGKAALVAAAFDDRIALAIPLQAGCGGTAPSRGKVGESVQQINDHFPHWFNAEFKKFSSDPDKLPFDQHSLIALCAPRPVLLPNAVEDQWANPKGQFEMLQAANPVYRLLGTEGIQTAQMPETGTLVDSTLGYYIRPGKHSMTKSDWKVFLDFADKHFGSAR